MELDQRGKSELQPDGVNIVGEDSTRQTLAAIGAPKSIYRYY